MVVKGVLSEILAPEARELTISRLPRRPVRPPEEADVGRRERGMWKDPSRRIEGPVAGEVRVAGRPGIFEVGSNGCDLRGRDRHEN